jgi:hypothetical protein
MYERRKECIERNLLDMGTQRRLLTSAQTKPIRRAKEVPFSIQQYDRSFGVFIFRTNLNEQI